MLSLALSLASYLSVCLPHSCPHSEMAFHSFALPLPLPQQTFCINSVARGMFVYWILWQGPLKSTHLVFFYPFTYLGVFSPEPQWGVNGRKHICDIKLIGIRDRKREWANSWTRTRVLVWVRGWQSLNKRGEQQKSGVFRGVQ